MLAKIIVPNAFKMESPLNPFLMVSALTLCKENRQISKQYNAIIR
jgi:hypothetical protein